MILLILPRLGRCTEQPSLWAQRVFDQGNAASGSCALKEVPVKQARFAGAVPRVHLRGRCEGQFACPTAMTEMQQLRWQPERVGGAGQSLTAGALSGGHRFITLGKRDVSPAAQRQRRRCLFLSGSCEFLLGQRFP